MPKPRVYTEQNRRGFTLIELLITISIIAILSAIGLVVYSSVLKQGRDSKRQSDLRSIQSALEQYYTDQFFYPSSLPAAGNPLTSNTGNPNPGSSPKTYLNSMPSDSDSSKRYYYAPSGTSYELCAALDIPPNPVQSCGGSCGSACNFRVTTP